MTSHGWDIRGLRSHLATSPGCSLVILERAPEGSLWISDRLQNHLHVSCEKERAFGSYAQYQARPFHHQLVQEILKSDQQADALVFEQV